MSYCIHQELAGKVFVESVESFDSLPFQLLGRLDRAIAECRSSNHFDKEEYNWQRRIAESKRANIAEDSSLLIPTIETSLRLFTTYKALGNILRFNYLPVLTMLQNELVNSDLLNTPFDKFAASLLDTLPHGSGIDGEWNVEIKPDEEKRGGYSVTCANGYHAMDHGGGYAGWLDFTLAFWLDNDMRPRLTEYGSVDFSIEYDTPISELVKQNDIEYPQDEDSFEFFGVDWEGIDESLGQSLGFALDELRGKDAA